MDTRKKILTAALRLFNSKGVEKITTRHIAAEIGISQGNLHYHFPGKDDVILALHKGFLEKAASAARYKGEGLSREDMLGSMEENFRLMHEYRFLFVDKEIVWRRIPEIKRSHHELIRQKHGQLLEIIRHLSRHGLLRRDLSPEQQHFLADQMIFIILTWLNAGPLMNYKGKPWKYFSGFAYRTWLPYLSEKEAEEWEKWFRCS